MWRLLTHERLTLSRHELYSQWSLVDACEAHDVLDEIDRRVEEASRANG